MNLPFVSRARFDLYVEWSERSDARYEAMIQRADMREAHLRAVVDTLREDHREVVRALATQAGVPRTTSPLTITTVAPLAPLGEVIEPPDVPADVVLAAMRTISPTRDKTYDANWAFWEQNKERAAKHPEDFADEILRGAT